MSRSLAKRDSMSWRTCRGGAFVLLYFMIPHPAAIPVPVTGQQPQIPMIRVETDLVEVPATVTDGKGRPITGLTSKDFTIYEDGVEQSLHHFTSESGPVSWGLILDRSASMTAMMEEVYTAAIHMVESATPESEAFIMTFSDQTQLVLGFTADRARMRRAVSGLRPGSTTALWDAVTEGLDEMKKASHNRKALVVVTDGEDNQSFTTPKDLIERVKESDVLVYSVAMSEMEEYGRPFWMFGGLTRSVLYDLAEASGAYAHRARSVEQCKRDMQRIAAEVNHQYVLGYYAQRASGPPRFRKLTLRVRTPERVGNAVIRARKGYFGPRDPGGPGLADGSGIRHL